MRLLLDTHVVIWTLADSAKLPQDIRSLIGSPDNEVYVSAVSILEVAIKYGLKKRSAPPFSATEMLEKCTKVGFEFLPVMPQHAAAVESSSFFHTDPFDRLLVAQALSEPMRLVSRDQRVAAYSDTIITW